MLFSYCAFHNFTAFAYALQGMSKACLIFYLHLVKGVSKAFSHFVRFCGFTADLCHKASPADTRHGRERV